MRGKVTSHKFMFFLASSISCLMSGVMLKGSFWGAGRGVADDWVVSGFRLFEREGGKKTARAMDLSFYFGRKEKNSANM